MKVRSNVLEGNVGTYVFMLCINLKSSDYDIYFLLLIMFIMLCNHSVDYAFVHGYIDVLFYLYTYVYLLIYQSFSY